MSVKRRGVAGRLVRAAGVCAALVAADTIGLPAPVGAQDPVLEEAPFARGVVPVARVGEVLDGTAFRMPMFVHYDVHHDEIFVADPGAGLVGIFEKNGVPKYSFSPGRDRSAPTAIDTDSEGNIYMLAPAAGRMLVFDYRGGPIREWPIGTIERIEAVPSGFRIGPEGMVYVLDGGGRRILVFTPDGEAVRVIRGTVRAGGRLQAPVDLAFDSRGNLYVSDAVGTPVQVYEPSGRFLRAWGRRDIGAADFSSPAGIAVDAWGLVFVADPLRQDVKVFDSLGTFQYRFGGFGPRPGDLSYPTDVATAPDGPIYVVERVGRRLQIFQRQPRPAAPDRAVVPSAAAPPSPAAP